MRLLLSQPPASRVSDLLLCVGGQGVLPDLSLHLPLMSDHLFPRQAKWVCCSSEPHWLFYTGHKSYSAHALWTQPGPAKDHGSGGATRSPAMAVSYFRGHFPESSPEICSRPTREEVLPLHNLVMLAAQPLNRGTFRCLKAHSDPECSGRVLKIMKNTQFLLRL